MLVKCFGAVEVAELFEELWEIGVLYPYASICYSDAQVAFAIFFFYRNMDLNTALLSKFKRI